METIIIGAVIALIALIVFFVMASRLSEITRSVMAIKKLLDAQNLRGTNYIKMAEEEKYIGNKDMAKEYLCRAKYHFEVKRDNSSQYNKNALTKQIEKIDKMISKL